MGDEVAQTKPEIELATAVKAPEAKQETGQDIKAGPEKQDLNQAKIEHFLTANNIGLKNLDEVFGIEMAIKMTNELGQKDINGQLTEAKTILDKYPKGLDMMKENSSSVVEGQLNRLKSPPANMPAEEATKVLQAFNYVNAMRDNARRLFRAKERIEEDLAVHKSGTDFMTAIKEKLSGVKENWDKISVSEKIILGGLALIAGGWFFLKKGEEGSTKEKLKGLFKNGLLLGGGAWAANKLVQLATGDSLYDKVTDRTKASSKQAKFFLENYHTDEKGAEMLSHSFVTFKDTPFLDLLKMYKEANTSQKIEGTSMKGDEAYQALKIFFGKYNAENLEKKYAKATPAVTYADVVRYEMAEDPSIAMEDNLASSIYDLSANKFKESYNYFATTAPVSWAAAKYRQMFNKEADKAEMDKFLHGFSYVAKDEDFNNTIETKVVPNDREASKNLIETSINGTTDTKYGLKYKQLNGYLYIIAERNLAGKMSDEKIVNETIESSVNQSEAFLANKLAISKDQVVKKAEIFGSVYLTSGKMEYLMRYKI